MKKLIFALMALAFCAAPMVARADWDPSDPFTKWVQMPDPNGWDVKVTLPKILADDWLCEEPLPVTDVHFWGSWKGDIVGQITNIHLSIHRDLVGADPSQPGQLVWDKDVDATEFRIKHWADGQQGWYDPNTGEYIPIDHYGIWQVNIDFTPEQYFHQEGTPDNPIVYWLDIQVTVADPINTDFGWKTSLDHWRDDACWRDVQWEPGIWEKLVDPLTGETLDMAFVITTIPEPGVFAIAGLGLLVLLRRRKR